MLIRVLALTALFTSQTFGAPQVIDLWPGNAPGQTGDAKPEADTTKPTDGTVMGKRVMRIGNVSKPSLTVMKPAKEKDTGAAIVIFPGGAYNILAWDLEGTEVAEWLNEFGVTGIVLKYRVPKKPGQEPHAVALQDAQRAVGLVRSQAKDLGIDPNRIGVLGFSAGGNLAATLCSHVNERTYQKIDAADDVSCRPDFQLLIYPAYLVKNDNVEELNPAVAVTEKHPKTFIMITEDDPVKVEGPLKYYGELKKFKIPAELHIYPTGGHGYGLRRSKYPMTTWPDRARDWLTANLFLVPGSVIINAPAPPVK
jgi:acetyl esterase/lipase